MSKHHTTSRLISFIPLVAGLILLAVGAAFVPWSKVWPYLVQLKPWHYAVLAALSALYYFGWALRYWVILRMLGQPSSFARVTMATLAAQPIAILPGGEFYRTAMLKRYCNVEFKDGIPSVFAQSIAEMLGLLIIALFGASLLHRYGWLVIVVSVAFVAVVVYIRFHNARQSHKIVNRVPKINISFRRIKNFLEKNRVLLSGWNFWYLLLVSYVTTIAGIGMVMFSLWALDKPLDVFRSSIAYALPLILQSLSFLPGGIGANEQSSVGILVLFHVGLPIAVAVTIIVRLFTLGIGFIYGFGALALDRALGLKRYN